MTFFLHPSSIDRFNDCQGAWAASNIPSIRKQSTGGKPFVGSVFGTTAHKAIAGYLKHKMAFGELPEVDDILTEAKHQLTAAFKDKKGIKLDTTTTSLESGLIQLELVIRESYYSFCRHINPLAVEQTLSVDIEGSDIRIIATPDVLTSERVHDHKFPRQIGYYAGQGGGYTVVSEALLERRMKGFDLEVIPRRGVNGQPGDLETISYTRDECLDAFWQGTKQLIKLLPVWKETKDMKIWSFNGSSKLCTETTCGLWGTSLCNQWKSKKGVVRKYDIVNN